MMSLLECLNHLLRAVTIASLGMSVVVHGQTEAPSVLYSIDGSRPGERLGWAMAGPGDLNGDGVPDVLAGGPGDFIGGGFPGIVRAYSGIDGSVLYTVSGTTNADGFGMSIAALPDIDGDTYRDFAVGAPYNDVNGADSGSVYIYSGATGALLNGTNGLAPGDAYGWSLCDGVDFDGNSVPDLIVGAPLVDGVGPDAGSVYAIDPISGAILQSFVGSQPYGQFGYSATSVRSIQFHSIFVGAPGEATPGVGSGKVYELANGAMSFVVAMYPGGGDILGMSIAGFLAPVGGIYPSVASTNSNPTAGVAIVTAVRTQAYGTLQRCEIVGSSVRGVFPPESAQCDFYSTGSTFPGYIATRHWYVNSACSAQSQSLNSSTAGLGRSWAAAALGDLNNDTWRDVAVGDPFVASPGLDSGRVAILLTQGPLSPPSIYCTAKVNSLGCQPRIAFEGAPTVSIGDNFVITASSVVNNKPGILIWAINVNNIPFGGGYLCLGPLLHRTPFQLSGGNPPPLDCSGSYSYHFSHAFMASQSLTPGLTVYAQYYSRDPGFPSPSDIGLTDAVRFTVLP